MKEQAVVISAYIAAVIIALTILVFMIQQYSSTGSYVLSSPEASIYSILTERIDWTARDLALEIQSRTGAVLVRVNISVYDLLGDRVVRTDYYAIEPLGVDLNELFIQNYTFARASRDAYLYTYYIVVGYR
ncbi:MAG: hypothetical protein ABWW65_04225 [Thermoprotei archaeon]